MEELPMIALLIFVAGLVASWYIWMG